MYAAERGMDDLVCLLVQHKAPIDDHDQIHGKTALMFATVNHHKTTVELLLSLGAKLTATDYEGRTAYDLTDSTLLRKILNPQRSLLERISTFFKS